jgi:MFS family permease
MADTGAPDLADRSGGLTMTQWLICIIASIGFAFDIYELLMLPLIIKPAMAALSGAPPTDTSWLPGGDNYARWARTLFFIPALAGGVFGLLGGYLTDRLGRRRVLTWSILLYAFSAFAAGFATNLYHLLICRCLVFIGVCVEFVAAVAWLAELFPEPKRREKVLGYTQAFSSLGGIMIAGAFYVAAHFADSLPAIHGQHAAWRYTLISGVIPALPLIFIRPFLPESPAWQKKKESGTLKRPGIGQLFQPQLIRTTLVTTIVFASSYGIAFGAIQQLPQIIGAAALNTPQERGQKQIVAAAKAAVGAEVQKAAAEGRQLTPLERRNTGMNASDSIVATVSSAQELGGLFGRVFFAIIAVWFVSRRALLRVFQIPALLFVPLFFWWISRNLNTDSLTLIKVGIFICGFVTVAQFSFWGNYIPLVFPVHLRGTGESFAANIGGRVVGTAAAFFAISLSSWIPGEAAGPVKLAIASALIAGVYVLIGAIATQWLPEPKETHDHDEPAAGPAATQVPAATR